MAHISVNAPAHHSILHFVTAPFRVIGNAMIALGEANSRSSEMRILLSLSDDELAKRGIKREEIVHHVFKDIYYV